MRVTKQEELEILRTGGRLLGQILRDVVHEVRPGVTAFELDQKAEQLIAAAGARPSFKGFEGYPAATCVSINAEVVHGIPTKKKVVREGDIVSVDVGIEYKGLFTDTATTIAVGKVSRDIGTLLRVTERSLAIGIQAVRPGGHVGDIGAAIQAFVEPHGFGVVRALTGHGVGKAVHEEPKVPNFGSKGSGPLLEPGLVLAIEPMVTMGSPDVRVQKDHWTVVTADKSLASHVEHTIVVTEHGAEILTQRS